MKISQKTLSLIAAIALILLTIGKMGLFHHYPDKSFDVNGYTMEPTDLDSLEDGIREATNNLDKLKREKELYTKGFTGYSGYTFGVLGVVNLDFPKGHIESNRDFLKLTNIGLKFDDAEYNGKTYLAYQIKNKQAYLVTKKLIKNGKTNTVVNIYKKVDYKYSAVDNSIFVPVDSTFWRIFVTAISFLIMLLTLALYLFVIFTFFNFLLAVAKNRAFDEGNVQRLGDMALSLSILALSPYVLNLIIYLIFIANYSAQGITITKSFFEYEYYTLVFAILSYLIYHAFKKAMILQEESELTI